jgi:group I intron endonuclease
MIIYEIRYLIENRPYIGYSTKFNSSEEFLNSDYWGSGTYISPAIKKYGTEAFERKVLLKNIFNRKQLKEYEKIWIKKKKSHVSQGGYNLTWGGDGNTNPTEETRQKLSKAQSGEKNNMFGRTGEKSPFYGAHHTEEVKQKISKAQSGENNHRFGTHPIEATIQKMKDNHWDNSGENSPVARPVILISPEGVEYNLPCYHPFCKEHELSVACICAVLQGKQKNHKGWTGRYLKNTK